MNLAYCYGPDRSENGDWWGQEGGGQTIDGQVGGRAKINVR